MRQTERFDGKAAGLVLRDAAQVEPGIARHARELVSHEGTCGDRAHGHSAEDRRLVSGDPHLPVPLRLLDVKTEGAGSVRGTFAGAVLCGPSAAEQTQPARIEGWFIDEVD